MVSVVKLTDIPHAILPVIGSGRDKSCYLNGIEINRIFLFRNQYRISSKKGEYRYPMDTDTTVEIY